MPIVVQCSIWKRLGICRAQTTSSLLVNLCKTRSTLFVKLTSAGRHTSNACSITERNEHICVKQFSQEQHTSKVRHAVDHDSCSRSTSYHHAYALIVFEVICSWNSEVNNGVTMMGCTTYYYSSCCWYTSFDTWGNSATILPPWPRPSCRQIALHVVTLRVSARFSNEFTVISKQPHGGWFIDTRHIIDRDIEQQRSKYWPLYNTWQNWRRRWWRSIELTY